MNFIILRTSASQEGGDRGGEKADLGLGCGLDLLKKVVGAGRSHRIQNRSEIGEGRMRKISFLRLPQNLTLLFMTLLTEMPRTCSVNHGCKIGLKKIEGPLEKSNLVIDFKCIQASE